MADAQVGAVQLRVIRQSSGNARVGATQLRVLAPKGNLLVGGAQLRVIVPYAPPVAPIQLIKVRYWNGTEWKDAGT